MNSKLFSALVLTSGLAIASATALAAKEECDQSWGATRGSGMHDTHMQRLHTALQLTPAQESAWAEFENRMQPMNMDFPKGLRWTDLSTPDRMDRMLENMRLRENVMAEKAAAVRQFYGSLSADQQRVFDRRFQRDNRGHMRHAIYRDSK
jgi:hypothetical protein